MASGEGAEPGSEAQAAAAPSALDKADACRREGNVLQQKGDYADACARYDAGLEALLWVKGEEEVKRATELRLALHLNAALTHLRRSNLRSAADHASGALAIDADNVKALYRRGCAKQRLAEHPGHEAEGPLAVRDFERVLELEPGNADAWKQLKQLRADLRKEEQERAKVQRETFKKVFASGKQLYDDVPEKDGGDPLPPGALRQITAAERARQVAVSAEQLHFRYSGSEPVLRGLSLQLRAGWCVGLVGNNATGKSTLARLLCGLLSPSGGEVVHHRQVEAQIPRLSSWVTIAWVPIAAVIGAVADPGEKQLFTFLVGRMRLAAWMLLCALVLLLAYAHRVVVGRRRDRKRRQYSVKFVSSEPCDKTNIGDSVSIEQAIGKQLPAKMARERRRQKVIAMLTAAGFQMYNQSTGEAVGTPADYIKEGLKFGQLSGGQKHLIYVLSCLATAPEVLICDEALGGLDAFRQPRVLHMLRRMKEDMNVAMLYITTELHQQRVIADSLGFVTNGRICELGPMEDVLDFPKHPTVKEYIGNYRGLPGCHHIGGKLAENYSNLAGDEALAADWLPRL